MGFVHVRSLQKGDHFGELALINNDKRSLSIRVKSPDCSLLKLDRDTFSRILGSIDTHLMKDYNKEFDRKIEDIMQNKRTFSQEFVNQEFQELMQAAQYKREKSSLTNYKMQVDTLLPHQRGA